MGVVVCVCMSVHVHVFRGAGGRYPTYHHDVILDVLAADSQVQVSSSSKAGEGH